MPLIQDLWLMDHMLHFTAVVKLKHCYYANKIIVACYLLRLYKSHYSDRLGMKMQILIIVVRNDISTSAYQFYKHISLKNSIFLNSHSIIALIYLFVYIAHYFIWGGKSECRSNVDYFMFVG